MYFEYTTRCSNRDRNKSMGRTKVEIDNYAMGEPRTFHKRGTIKVALEDTHVVEKAEGQKEMQERHSKEAAQHLQRQTSGSQPFMFKVITRGGGVLRWNCWSSLSDSGSAGLKQRSEVWIFNEQVDLRFTY